MNVGRISCFLSLALFISTFAVAGDWPQILGPARNGAAPGESLANAWPKSGPKVAWNYKLGQGFSGPAVVGDRVVVFHRVDDSERVEAIDAKTGKRVWKTDFDATYRGSINPDSGPRCVPLVHQEKVIVYGAAGDLHCLSLKDGKKLWSRETHVDFDAREGYFGAGSSPIAVGDKVLVNVGGRKGAIVAFHLKDGKTAWTAFDDDASYSSPTLATIDGKPAVIFVTRLHCTAIDPKSGKTVFEFPFGKRGPTVNAAAPLVIGDQLFLSASYGIGAHLYRLGKQPKEVWSSNEVMSSQYTTCVHRDGYLYGVDGREDIGTASLRCVELKTGKAIWSARDFDVAHLILAGDKLLAVKNNGTIALIKADPTKHVALAEAKLFDGTVRALPALSGGKLYVRDNSGQGGNLKCIEVGGR